MSGSNFILPKTFVWFGLIFGQIVVWVWLILMLRMNAKRNWKKFNYTILWRNRLTEGRKCYVRKENHLNTKSFPLSTRSIELRIIKHYKGLKMIGYLNDKINKTDCNGWKTFEISKNSLLKRKTQRCHALKCLKESSLLVNVKRWNRMSLDNLMVTCSRCSWNWSIPYYSIWPFYFCCPIILTLISIFQ